MGNRISISFKNEEEESVVLFSHWDGRTLLNKAIEYVKKLKKLPNTGISKPLDRLEPATVLVGFMLDYITDFDGSNYYLGATKNDGDNSDNGHFTIDVNDPTTINKGEAKCPLCEEGDLKHVVEGETHIYSCTDCPFLGVEYKDGQNLKYLVDYCNKN